MQLSKWDSAWLPVLAGAVTGAAVITGVFAIQRVRTLRERKQERASNHQRIDQRIDEALEESFPASDAPGY